MGRLDGGAVTCVESGWVLPREIPRGGDIKLEVIGTRGTARVDLVEQGLAVCLTGERYERPSFGHAIRRDRGLPGGHRRRAATQRHRRRRARVAAGRPCRDPIIRARLPGTAGCVVIAALSPPAIAGS